MDHILSQFEPISLDEMRGIRLMNRTDTKFVTNMPQLLRLLELARSQYRVQDIDKIRIADYYTLYFDTPALDMYHVHQAGHTNRQKLRIRSYVDSHLDFLEVKTKNNHARTKKKRTDMHHFDPLHPALDIHFDCQNEEYQLYDEFLRAHLKYDPAAVFPKLENRFKRITLVNKGLTERLTIDSTLFVHSLSTDISRTLDNIVIIELKRDGLQYSPIVSMLNQLRIKPMGFSKYCIGSALTDPDLKQNRFKERLRTIDKIAHTT